MPAIGSDSSYVTSKLAATKVYETYGKENPHIEVTHIHPGVIESDLSAKGGITAKDTRKHHRKHLS